MKTKKKILDIAIGKCTPVANSNGDHYGYLTPAEILALIKAGVRKHDKDINYIEDQMRKGEGGRESFRFFPNGLKMKHSICHKNEK